MRLSNLRQIWIRLPDGQLAEIPWIHRDHTHHPFNEHTWNHIRATITHYTGRDPDTREADLADALDQLMRRARNQSATPAEQRLLARTTPTRTPPTGQHRPGRPGGPDPYGDRTGPATGHDSLDELDDTPDDDSPDEDTINDDNPDNLAPHTGYGLYDAAAEALKW